MKVCINMDFCKLAFGENLVEVTEIQFVCYEDLKNQNLAN